MGIKGTAHRCASPPVSAALFLSSSLLSAAAVIHLQLREGRKKKRAVSGDFSRSRLTVSTSCSRFSAKKTSSPRLKVACSCKTCQIIVRSRGFTSLKEAGLDSPWTRPHQVDCSYSQMFLGLISVLTLLPCSAIYCSLGAVLPRPSSVPPMKSTLSVRQSKVIGVHFCRLDFEEVCVSEVSDIPVRAVASEHVCGCSCWLSAAAAAVITKSSFFLVGGGGLSIPRFLLKYSRFF